MIRILHTADWHLGRSLHSFSLHHDQETALIQVLDELDNGYDAILISGDLYDRAVPAVEVVKLFSTFLKEVSRKNVTCVIISGNHDSAERLGFADTILDGAGIHFRCDYSRIQEPIRISNPQGEQVDIFALPFVEPLLMRQALSDERITNHCQAVQRAVELMRSARRDEVPAVLMAHAFVGEGAQRSESERTFIGGAQIIDVDLLRGFDYVALGHLHKPQEVDNPCIRYSGSLLPYSFSEASQDKHMVRVEWDGSSKPVLTPVPVRSLHQLVVIEDTFQNLLTSPEYQPYINDFISAHISDDKYHINTFTRLKQRFEFLLELRQPSLEAHVTPMLAGKKNQTKDSVLELLESFLDHFGWKEPMERKTAKGIFEKAYRQVQAQRREVVL